VWDSGWEVHDLSLEDIVLAYLGQAAAEQTLSRDVEDAATPVALGSGAGTRAGDRQKGRRA
jgi:hypothetical protein